MNKQEAPCCRALTPEKLPVLPKVLPIKPTPDVGIYYDWRDKEKIEVRQSPLSGNGVFAREPIAAGEVIERCRIILTDIDEEVKHSALYPYLFVWDEKRMAIPFGNAPLYNHSDASNAEVRSDGDTMIVFVALKAIAAGEEILIDYQL